MKKFLVTGIGVLFILYILVFTSYSNNLASAGNEITEFEYEYYYNDDNNIGDAEMNTNQNPVTEPEDGKKDKGKDNKQDDGQYGKQDIRQESVKDSSRDKERDEEQDVKQDSIIEKDKEQEYGRDDNKKITKSESKTGSKNDNSIGVDIEPDSVSVFVNKEYALPESYIPENLVVPDIKFYGGVNNNKNKLRQEAAEAIEKMFCEALDDGIVLYGVSGYRSYARQKEIYDKNVRMRGIQATNKVSAAPGHSEHQTGLAMDISTKSLGGALTEKFGDTPEGKWVAKNCYQYGFIIRYPENTEQITGYSYEPWHIRYVGTEISEYIHNEGITFEEYYGYTLDEYYLDNIISDSGTNE